MDQVTHILVIIDPTSSEQPCVDKAGALARKLDAKVTLLACLTKDSPTLQPLFDRLVRSFEDRGVEVTAQTIHGDSLSDSLLGWIANCAADLVVKDTHHHSLLKRTVIGNTDWRLIRECPLDLLLTKPKAWDARPVFAVAVGPAAANDCAELVDQELLDCTASLARFMNGDLHVIRAYLPPPHPAGVVTADEALQRTSLKTLTDRLGIGDQNVHVGIGNPIDYVPRVADEYHVDVMVMGAPSQRGMLASFIGSTSERVLESTPCDILVVKSPNFSRGLAF